MRFSTKMNEYKDKQWKKELKPYYMGIRKLNKKKLDHNFQMMCIKG